MIAGGVSANITLRETLTKALIEKAQVYYPRLEFCTDNGAMIAFVGAQRLKHNVCKQSLSVEVKARWPISELNSSQKIASQT